MSVSVLIAVLSTNNFSEYVIERTELPKHLIKSAGGEYLLEETQPKVGNVFVARTAVCPIRSERPEQRFIAVSRLKAHSDCAHRRASTRVDARSLHCW
jgi:hypothetical protein